MQRVLRPRAARGGTVASSSHTASSSHAVVISTTSDADSEQDIDSEPESDTEVSDIYVPQVVGAGGSRGKRREVGCERGRKNAREDLLALLCYAM